MEETWTFKLQTKKKKPVDGRVELSFQLSSGPAISVPFLVFLEEISIPIIGFNVIFELLKGW